MAPLPTTQRSGPSRAILLVDDDEDLRETVGDLLRFEGLGACVCAASLAEVEAQRAAVLDCALAILDINLGSNQPSGIEVYRWLERAQFGGKIVFLTGYGPNDPLVQEAARIRAATILSKPIPVADLVALVADAQGAGIRNGTM